ncbi:hypothetical protein ACYSNW_01335 [Enterococcus sp. LJL99]
MKTAVAMVYELLKNEALLKSVDIHTNGIPETKLTSPVLPIMRIIELQGDYTDFSSDNPLTITFYIQIDLWVSNLKEVDTYYYALDLLMRKNGWECTYTEQTDDEDLKNAKRIIKRYIGTMNLEMN